MTLIARNRKFLFQIFQKEENSENGIHIHRAKEILEEFFQKNEIVVPDKSWLSIFNTAEKNDRLDYRKFLEISKKRMELLNRKNTINN